MNEISIKRDINEAQGDYTTMDLSEIVLDLESVKDNLLMIRQMFKSGDVVRGDIIDSGLFLLEKAIERSTQDLMAIPYKPHRKEGVTNGTK